MPGFLADASVCAALLLLAYAISAQLERTAIWGDGQTICIERLISGEAAWVVPGCYKTVEVRRVSMCDRCLELYGWAYWTEATHPPLCDAESAGKYEIWPIKSSLGDFLLNADCCTSAMPNPLCVEDSSGVRE